MIKLLILSSLLLQGLLATTTDNVVIPLKVGSHTLEIKNALPYFMNKDKPCFSTEIVIRRMGKSLLGTFWDTKITSTEETNLLSKDTNGTLVLDYTLKDTKSDNVSLECVTNQPTSLKLVNMDSGYCVIHGSSTYNLEMTVSGKDYTLAPTVEPTPSPTPSPDSDSQVTEPKDSSSANLVSKVTPMLLLLVAGLATNPYL